MGRPELVKEGLTGEDGRRCVGMKQKIMLPTVFLAVGTLLLALLLWLAETGVLPRGKHAAQTADGMAVQVTEPMNGEETLAFYADRYQTGADAADRVLGAQVESFADSATLVVSIPLEVTSGYTPSLDLYCRVDDPEGPVLSVYSVQLCGEDGDAARPFAGNVEVFLRGDREIEYIINGDFFRSGTMEAERAGRVDVGPDSSDGVAFAITDGDPDEQGGYCYQSGTVTI